MRGGWWWATTKLDPGHLFLVLLSTHPLHIMQISKAGNNFLLFCHFTLFVLTEVLFLCLFCNFRLKLSWVESGLLNNRNFAKSPLVFTFINSLLEFIFIKTVGVYFHKWTFVARKAHFSDHGGQTAKSIAIALVWILDPTHLCFGFLCVVVF